MIRDITIGQYYPQDSVIHALDPRVKIINTFLFIISLFIFKSWLAYILFTVAVFTCIKVSKVPLRYILKGLKPILMILMLTVIMNLLFTQNEDAIFRWGIICISTEGIVQAIFMGIRLVYLVLGSSLMTFTTSPNRLTDGIESVLSWLKYFKVPVSDVAMMMTIALRFIPILVDETDKIMKAQMARGVDFQKGNLIKRMKNMMPLLVPLFVSAFKRANDLAQAMEARCYRGGDTRTKMKPLQYEKRDYIVYMCTGAFIALLIITKIIL